MTMTCSFLSFSFILKYLISLRTLKSSTKPSPCLQIIFSPCLSPKNEILFNSHASGKSSRIDRNQIN